MTAVGRDVTFKARGSAHSGSCDYRRTCCWWKWEESITSAHMNLVHQPRKNKRAGTARSLSHSTCLCFDKTLSHEFQKTMLLKKIFSHFRFDMCARHAGRMGRRQSRREQQWPSSWRSVATTGSRASEEPKKAARTIRSHAIPQRRARGLRQQAATERATPKTVSLLWRAWCQIRCPQVCAGISSWVCILWFQIH